MSRTYILLTLLFDDYTLSLIHIQMCIRDRCVCVCVCVCVCARLQHDVTQLCFMSDDHSDQNYLYVELQICSGTLQCSFYSYFSFSLYRVIVSHIFYFFFNVRKQYQIFFNNDYYRACAIRKHKYYWNQNKFKPKTVKNCNLVKFIRMN